MFSGAAIVPRTGGLMFSTVVRYLSGTAFTVQDTTLDNDRNGILFEPLPAGTYSGTGTNADHRRQRGGRNGARGPSFFQADVRLGYRISSAARKVELFGEVLQPDEPGQLREPDRRSVLHGLPGSPRCAPGPRRGRQFGARFEF